MATREKKLSVGRKQNTSSPLPPKENVTSGEAKTNTNNEDSEDSPPAVKNATPKVAAAKGASLIKKLANKNPPKKLAKKPIAIKLKPTIKKNVKIKQKIIKAMLNNPKNKETKKKLLKNCVKQIKPKKAKMAKNDKTEENLPPVLEPILPIDEDLETKQSKKKAGRPPRIDNYAKKINQSDNEHLIVDQSKTKRVYKKKVKTESLTNETIEDVMNDLSSLIKGSEIKNETDVLSESSKSDSLKPKKVLKKKKKENLENTLSKLSPSERKVIDMLDLNVSKFKGLPIAKRRHSIEKFPVGTVETDATNLNRLSILNNLPRCMSPRSKNFPKIKPVDGLSRRSNPYKMRSDSPARILRNGKQRKLKDLELLEGLDIKHKRRRRNCSEFSGSEMSLSKFSGYESDSSFSDMSSLHGAENTEPKDIEHIKSESKENYEVPEEFSENHVKIKRSLSTDVDTNAQVVTDFTDTNSNLCMNVNKENDTPETPIKVEDISETVVVSPSEKVPEKSIILGIMKQTFNDTFEENHDKDRKYLKPKTVKKPETVSPDSFYGKSTEMRGETEKIDKSPKDTVKEMTTDEDVAGETKNGEQLDGESENGIVENLDDEKKKMINGNIDESEPVVQNGDSHKKETKIEETPENLAIKENILQALGLQSLKAAREARLKHKEKAELRNDYYTGTLKTVIKINRGDKKKGRNSMKMSLYKNKNKSIDYDTNGIDDCCRATKDGPSTSWKHGGQSSDTAGAHRKSHYSNRSNMDGSSEHTSDGETGTQEGSTKALVIPEKASSFSIHPGRVCKDECSYCFGKFGLFDTPCHIAQMKSVDRQNKILATEKHLMRDSCLCDACYRHVDRKANTPSYTNKSYKRSAMVAPGPRQDHCHVLGCHKIASNILRRKWIIKMRRSICEVINIDLDNPGLHSIPICDEHYSALEYLMVCAMCKRRLAKNHVHYLGPETDGLNSALTREGIPLTLTDKPVVCKLCKYFAAIILKSLDDRPENSSTFFLEYKKRLLHFNDIVPMDEAAAEEPIIIPTKDKIEREQIRKKRKLSKNQSVPGDGGSDSQVEVEKSDQSRVPSSDSTNQSRPESPSDYMVDYNTLIPSIAMECGSDSESKKETTAKPAQLKKIPRPETVKQAVEISKNMKLKNDKSSDIAVQRLGSNPSISVRQLFPCEEDLPLQGHIEFGNVKERTPEGWEKCTAIIQYDMETKHLWQELQKPYGNQSSFLRHLILLEKYFRNGDLVLAPNASHHSINYSESVHNRLRAYDNIPSSAGNVQPISMLPFNKAQKSNSGIITSTKSSKENQTSVAPPVINAANLPKSTPITISQLNSPPLIPPAVIPKAKPVGAPPGLISLHPGTNRPVAPLVKVPQSQKIKFPITKNWRPNLIPIDPNKKNTERKAGLVQVISGGKPYHITLEDYKKMCAIKKSFELKQKRLQEASHAGKSMKVAYNSVLKSMAPRKGLVISKTSMTTTTATNPKTEPSESENILEKLDKQVEKLESRLSENKPPLTLPKIPKSLTVIPQTVTRKPSRPSSPVLLITPKPKQITNKS
ncbi:uncharacterized protein BDFB_004147 [Asbolus verrucosus]|uniref:Uncharacterized protein n=1 Tax=Asbolus verrucosus TaxID=1661398 RepID=A0A482VWT5_ASBVE|nr:uncharacterized protein BDFB_004147 [Asbolus verrucosus]